MIAKFHILRSWTQTIAHGFSFLMSSKVLHFFFFELKVLHFDMSILQITRITSFFPNKYYFFPNKHTITRFYVTGKQCILQNFSSCVSFKLVPSSWKTKNIQTLNVIPGRIHLDTLTLNESSKHNSLEGLLMKRVMWI